VSNEDDDDERERGSYGERVAYEVIDEVSAIQMKTSVLDNIVERDTREEEKGEGVIMCMMF